MRKKMYEINCEGYIVKGRASSPQNACRLAFNKLIEAGLIKRQPATDPDSESTFKNTTVKVIKDEL